MGLCQIILLGASWLHPFIATAGENEDKSEVSHCPKISIVKYHPPLDESQENDQASLTSLPEELILQIFSYLPTMTDLLQARGVCTLFYRIAHDPSLWRRHSPKNALWLVSLKLPEEKINILKPLTIFHDIFRTKVHIGHIQKIQPNEKITLWQEKITSIEEFLGAKEKEYESALKEANRQCLSKFNELRRGGKLRVAYELAREEMRNGNRIFFDHFWEFLSGTYGLDLKQEEILESYQMLEEMKNEEYLDKKASALFRERRYNDLHLFYEKLAKQGSSWAFQRILSGSRNGRDGYKKVQKEQLRALIETYCDQNHLMALEIKFKELAGETQQYGYAFDMIQATRVNNQLVALNQPQAIIRMTKALLSPQGGYDYTYNPTQAVKLIEKYHIPQSALKEITLK